MRTPLSRSPQHAPEPPCILQHILQTSCSDVADGPASGYPAHCIMHRRRACTHRDLCNLPRAAAMAASRLRAAPRRRASCRIVNTHILIDSTRDAAHQKLGTRATSSPPPRASQLDEEFDDGGPDPRRCFSSVPSLCGCF